MTAIGLLPIRLMCTRVLKCFLCIVMFLECSVLPNPTYTTLVRLGPFVLMKSGWPFPCMLVNSANRDMDRTLLLTLRTDWPTPFRLLLNMCRCRTPRVSYVTLLLLLLLAMLISSRNFGLTRRRLNAGLKLFSLPMILIDVRDICRNIIPTHWTSLYLLLLYLNRVHYGTFFLKNYKCE